MYILDIMDTSLFITQGGRYHCTPANWKGNDHWNTHARVYAPVTGRGWVKLDDHRTPLSAGHLYLIPPHHRLAYAADPEMTVNWLHFIPTSPLLDARLASIDRVCIFEEETTKRWHAGMQRCAALLTGPSPAVIFHLQGMVSELIGLLLERTPDASPDSRLLPALRYMNDHIMEPVTLDAIAASAGMSAEHFHRLFRKQFHTTPRAMLLSRRMAKARQQLVGGAFTVKEVAAQCGYEDPYYFSRVFRKHYGCTAQEVRSGKARPLP